MARTKKVVSAIKEDKFRDRKFALLLYPDDKSHMVALEYIKANYDCAYILHDEDVWTQGEIDEIIAKDGKCEYKVGELKKSHYHVIIVTGNNAIWNTALSEMLGISKNYIRKVGKLDRALEYLIHYNDADKHEYSLDKVQGVLKNRIKASINATEKTEGEKVVELIDYIEEKEDVVTMTEFSRYCATSGYWDVFRRAGAIFSAVINEHNEKVKQGSKKRYNPQKKYNVDEDGCIIE